MGARTLALEKESTASTFTPVRSGLLQRKCACGGSPGITGECEECSKKRLTMQRYSTNQSEQSVVPPILHDVLHSPGQPLDPATRALMESRFGHDFSRVRVHSDTQAADSAQTVNALAYTVGWDVVFGAGQYAPYTSKGKQLLAHELTHVVQQVTHNNLAPSALAMLAETEAEETSQRAAGGAAVQVNSFVGAGTVQYQKDKNPLEDKAKAIIAKAKDEKVDLAKRAVTLVNDIIATYYTSDAAKVDSVVYDDGKAGTGLQTESVGSGASAKGKIYVGNYFVTHVDAFARRVLQVEHELMHIDQYRGGLAGGQNKDKREFLAFHHEALEKEKPGTGRTSYSTRLAIIDAALGYYYCLSDADQKAFADKKEGLLKRRQEVNGKAGNAPIPEPTACKRQS